MARVIAKACSEIDREVAQRVRLLRISRGKSQEWLGEQLGLSFQQVQKYEKGKNRIGTGRLAQISTALEVTPAYFFGNDNDSAGTANPNESDQRALSETVGLLTDPGALLLVRAYHAMSPGKRAVLRHLAEAMVPNQQKMQ
jgi:transcriptional regulator with XRE-family HTH domain